MTEEVRLPFRLSDALSGAKSILSIIVVLVGVVGWLVNMQNKINYLDVRDREHPTKQELSETAIKIDGRISDLERRRLETYDAAATAIIKLGVVSNRQEEIFRRVDTLEREREILNRVTTQTEVLNSQIKRLEEQQSRIIQALDNTYNTLQEALRVQSITRQPTPTDNQHDRYPH